MKDRHRKAARLDSSAKKAESRAALREGGWVTAREGRAPLRAACESSRVAVA
jgi:hypothetical protein